MLTERYLRAVKVDPLGVGKASVEGWCPVLVTLFQNDGWTPMWRP